MNQPQVLYRVQNKEGQGPYRDRYIVSSILSHHNDDMSGQHPTPCLDPKINRLIKKEEKCAFLSLNDLLKWFTDNELDALGKWGYGITQVIGIVTAIGKHQVLYIPIDKLSMN